MGPPRHLGRLHRRDLRPGGPPGKLKEAAEALAYRWTGRADPRQAGKLDAETIEQFKALGDVVGLPDRPVPDGSIEIWDVNWQVFQLFQRLATQFRVVVVPRGLFHLGLDYQAADIVLRHLAPEEADPATLFADLQEMEAAAVPILNEAMT
ncbi:DUF1799 domain-containing protein [Labrys neptuniae]|uniref:DUF1799 domain-containing protein n=1 Tax=Labrys neptuniae TaxID=376174 RepID=A0ABV3PGG8_9HYPH